MTPRQRAWLRAFTLVALATSCGGDDPRHAVDAGPVDAPEGDAQRDSAPGVDARAASDGCSHCGDSRSPIVCADGETSCGGRCVDLVTDRSNCGACDAGCGFGWICRDGECTEDTCRFPGMRCGDGECVDLSSDDRHCGDCDRPCGALGHCEDFRCTCAGSAIECASRCVDVRWDADHCGGCGRACADGDICVLSECMSASCDRGTFCEGRCTALDRDPTSCGACGRRCRDDESCEAGECVCGPGLVRCGDTCVDLSSDASHCGGCDQTCWTLPFCTAPACIGGRCSTPPPSIACSGRCVFYRSDPHNCGGCGREVPDGFSCRDGRVACYGGQVCDGGCYALDDPDRCGACAATCEGETPVCQRFAGGAACRARCDEGLVPCDGTCRGLQSNPLHCGACGHRCGPRQECASGACRCAAAFADCSAAGELTCSDLRYDSSNCGECGRVCARGTYCLLSRCVPL